MLIRYSMLHIFQSSFESVFGVMIFATVDIYFDLFIELDIILDWRPRISVSQRHNAHGTAQLFLLNNDAALY